MAEVDDTEEPPPSYVPDGDPCPKGHKDAEGNPLPARLHWLQGFGFYSQCEGCKEAFLVWYSQSVQGPMPPLPHREILEPPPAAGPQGELRL